MSSSYNPNFITTIQNPSGIDIQNNSLFIGCNTCGTVSKYDILTGQMTTLITDVSASVVVSYNNIVYTSDYSSGKIRAFNITTTPPTEIKDGSNNYPITRGLNNGTGFAIHRGILFACFWGLSKIGLYNASTGSELIGSYISSLPLQLADLTIDPELNYLYVVVSGSSGYVNVYDISGAFTGSYTPTLVNLINPINNLSNPFGIVCRGDVLYISLQNKVVTYNSKTGAAINNAFVNQNDISFCYYLTTNGSVDSYLYTASTTSGRVGRFALPNLSNNKFIDLNHNTMEITTSTHNLGLTIANNIVYAVRNTYGIGSYNAITGATINETLISETPTDLSFSRVEYYNNLLYVGRFASGKITTHYLDGTIHNSFFINNSGDYLGGIAFYNNILFVTQTFNRKISLYNPTPAYNPTATTANATQYNSNYISISDCSFCYGNAINPDLKYLYVIAVRHQSTGGGDVLVFDISNVSTPGVIPASNITAGSVTLPNSITGLTRPYAIVYRGNVLYISLPDRVVSYNATTGEPINGNLSPFVPINDISSVNNRWTSIAADSSAFTNASLFTFSYNTAKIGKYSLPNLPIICFKEDTRILTDKGYKNIQDLRKGMLVKTSRDGYKAIHMIGKKVIKHIASEERIKDQLYRCSKNKFPELWDDLIITGRHSILVDGFTSAEERTKTEEVNKGIFVTDGKYRIPACVDGRTSVYEIPGDYTVYHFALENDDIQENYGVYANGLLVESCSILVLNVLYDLKSYNLIVDSFVEDKETFAYVSGKIELLD